MTPTQAGSAFVPLVGVDLELLLSIQHERTVNNDSVVSFESLSLQLPRRTDRAHYVRCPVLVHEFPQGTLGVSYQGLLLARYTREGQLLSVPPAPRPHRRRSTRKVPGAGHPTPRHSSPLGGAAAHNVDGNTALHQHPNRYATARLTAVHNVDSSFHHRPPHEVRTNKKTDSLKFTKTRKKKSLQRSGHL